MSNNGIAWFVPQYLICLKRYGCLFEAGYNSGSIVIGWASGWNTDAVIISINPVTQLLAFDTLLSFRFVPIHRIRVNLHRNRLGIKVTEINRYLKLVEPG
jgi:hypothetical protein